MPGTRSELLESSPPKRLVDEEPLRGEDGRASTLAWAVERAKQSDRDAIGYLYLRYSDSVCQYVRGIVRDHHEAEDITQHVFAKLMTAIAKYEERAVPFSAWILRVARNAALDHLRGRRPIPCEELRGVDDESVDAGSEQAKSIREALGSLPEEQRKVVVMRHVLGLSPPEIANQLGKTEGSVHGLHHRGRRALQEQLTSMGAAPAVTTASPHLQANAA